MKSRKTLDGFHTPAQNSEGDQGPLTKFFGAERPEQRDLLGKYFFFKTKGFDVSDAKRKNKTSFVQAKRFLKAEAPDFSNWLSDVKIYIVLKTANILFFSNTLLRASHKFSDAKKILDEPLQKPKWKYHLLFIYWAS